MRASCWVSVLPPSTVPGSTQIADEGAAERDGIDARVHEEAVIFDGDERLLQRRRNRVERDVLPLFIQPEPAAAVGGVEPRVADASRQPVHVVRLPRQPDAGHDAGDDEDRQEDLRAPTVGAERAEHLEIGQRAGPRR